MPAPAPAPIAPAPKPPWEEAAEAQSSGLMPWEEARHVQSGTLPPPTFGQQFMTRLGENVVNLGGMLTDPLGTLGGLAESVMNPPRHLVETGSRMLHQTTAQNAADLAFQAGASGIGMGLGKAGSTAARAAGNVEGGTLIRLAIRPKATLAKMILDALETEAPQKLQAPPLPRVGARNFPAPEDLPQVQVIKPPPLGRMRGVEEPTVKPIPAPGVSFRSEVPPRITPPPGLGPMRGVPEPEPSPVISPPGVSFRDRYAEPGSAEAGTPPPPSPKPIAPSAQATVAPAGATQPNVPAEYSTHPSPKYAHARDIRLGDYLTTRGISAADIEALPKIKDRVEFLNDRIAQYNATRPKGAEKINPYSLKETRAGEPDLAARIGHLLNRLREK